MAGADASTEDHDLDDAKEAFHAAQEHEAENRRLWLDDLRFARLSEQWPEQIERQRRIDGRPCLTSNLLPAFLRQVTNAARQNRPGIVVHPVDSKADPETADVINGLIRQIEQSSDAEVAYDTALDYAASAGWGYFKVNTRYATDDSFEQDIVIEAVANPLSIFGDPDSTGADSSDWISAFELDQIAKAAFKRRWKDAEPVSFDDAREVGDKDRAQDDKLTIAAQWRREEVEKQIVALSMPDPMADPQRVAMAMALGVSERLIIDLETFEANQALFEALGMQVQGQPRPVPSYKVTQRILSGADVLEEIDWAGKYIPIVPVYGEEINVEGVRHFRSMIRDAKDEQRRYNFELTAATEMTALAPKAPFIGKKGAFETDQAKWATANSQNWSYIQYDGAEKPERQPFSSVPVAQIQLALSAADNLKRIIGIHDAGMGAEGNETTGRAILARQKESDTSNFHFVDNLSRAIRHGGRIVLDLIPKVYSTARVIRIIGQDGKQASVSIGSSQPSGNDNAPQQQPPAAHGLPVGASPPMAPPQAQAGMAPQQPPPLLSPGEQETLQTVARVFDLTAGKYDLTVQVGPAYASEREELNTILVELIRAVPQSAAVLMPLVVKTFDMPDADEVADALKAVNQQHQNPQAQQQAQQMGQALEQAHGQLQQLAQKLQQSQAQVQQVQNDQATKQQEMALKAQELDLKRYEAETDRLQAETDAQRAQREAMTPAYPGPLAA
jgi:hypothetical protein